MVGNRNYGDLEESRRILEIPKIFEHPIIMTTDLRSGDKSAFSGAPVLDQSSNESIVGLSLLFRTNRTPISQKHSLALALRVGGQLIFLYDLCIYPNEQRSHVDRKNKQKFFGSHVHTLGEVKSANLDYDSITWKDCLEIFAKDTNLTLASDKIVEPFAGELL